VCTDKELCGSILGARFWKVGGVGWGDLEKRGKDFSWTRVQCWRAGMGWVEMDLKSGQKFVGKGRERAS
jgi:hypothetical protein